MNLLPPKEKQELLFQKNRNLVIVLGSTATIFLVCFALVMLSLKFYVLQKVSHEKAVLKDIEEEYQTADFLSLLDAVKKYNLTLSKIESFYAKETRFSKVLKSIIEIEKPESMIFDSIVLEQAKTGNGVKTSIYGRADSRDELLSFKNNIEKQEKIKDVYLPPENLIKPSNINFFMTFKYE